MVLANQQGSDGDAPYKGWAIRMERREPENNKRPKVPYVFRQPHYMNLL